ncbi:terminase small subunit [Geminicoccus roseus]|uniref:terminase small subunit n=1 Tax=Geminicoccus roseus TaxID=404900 RepID=UPI00146FBC78|nr:terminase small subunit [Geminicoccus roseus]
MAELTEKQASFVVAYTSTPDAIGNASAAARIAGYSVNSAGEIGRQLLEKPHIIAAVRQAIRDQISLSLAGKAVRYLEALVDDETAPKKVRLDAAKTILDRAGIAAMPVQLTDDQPKSLKEMSIDELRALINEAEHDAADRAVPVLQS